MSLQPGTRLGPYEIVAPIGAGGMGEVYRGRDTRLDRSVAIKVLAGAKPARVPIRERFEREARAISSLSHPHICTLFDVGSEEGIDFLVMELIEGETLADRLSRGPLPIDQVLRYGTEIAEALAAAHRQGIVHRDLKPGNIMLTKGGVKLLDFGLARLREPEESDATGLTSLRTEHRPLTEEGTILGTFQYMAPEQVEGKEADARTDIFAFGAVLHEMATGRRAFEGKTRPSLIAAIIDRDPPPVSSVQPLAPPALDRVIRGCLMKDPDERWQSAHDVAAELRWIGEAGSQAGVAAPVIIRRKRREWTAWAAAALLAVAAAALGVVAWREKSARRGPIHAAIVLPPDVEIAGTIALSPDGQRLAFIGRSKEGDTSLWVRPLRGNAPQPLAGTNDASYPFWSPDSRFVGFFASGKLKKIDASGGPPQTLCDAAQGRGGSWSGNGTILFALVRDSIYQVSAAGGAPKKITTFDPKSEADHRWPFFLPDGEHFLYLARAEDVDQSVVWLGTLGSAERKRLMQSSSNPGFAAGRIFFVRDRTLLSQEFDLSSREVKGDPTPVAEQLWFNSFVAGAQYTLSDTGLLAYVQGVTQSQLFWYDRNGRELGNIGPPGNYSSTGYPALSPDGNRLATDLIDGGGRVDVWVHDLVRGTASRFTFQPFDEVSPVFSPDGRQMVYSIRPRPPGLTLVMRSSTGTGAEEKLWAAGDAQLYAADWSRDGRHLLVLYHNPKGKVINDLWIYSLPERKGRPLVQSPFNDFPGGFSPDGRWFVYSSTESGREEVYVQSLAGGGKWQISSSGGSAALWSKKGDEIFFMTPDRKLVAVPVKTGATFEAGSPQLLFEVRGLVSYNVSADSRRFVLLTTSRDSSSTPVTLVTDWPALLEKR